MTVTEREIAEVMPALGGVVRRHLRRFGGDREELMAEAMLALAAALPCYDPARGALGALARRAAARRLIALERPLSRRAARAAVSLGHEPPARGFDLLTLLASLPADAARATRLALEGLPFGTGDTRAGRACGRRWLAERLRAAGWDGRRIGAAFAAVAEGLAP